MVTRKQEDLVKNIKRNQMTKYVSPGVYVVERDISTYTPPKNFRRMKKISKIYNSIYTPPFIKKN
jgi:hypothetical protein